jgi:hypothetical protein
MRLKTLILPILFVTLGAQDAAAQSAAPRDVREVFLALPFPAAREGGRVLQAFNGRLATRAAREEALRGPVEVDTRNGYLALTLPGVNGAPMPVEAVLTYFNRADGRRLVVLQLRDWSTDIEEIPLTEDHAWLLSGATFTRTDIDDLLPNLEYNDFWDDVRPAALEKDFFMKMDAVFIEWPREGTTATLHIFQPSMEQGRPLDPKLAKIFSERARTAVELVWDRQQGRFQRGEFVEYSPEDEHDHHH